MIYRLLFVAMLTLLLAPSAWVVAQESGEKIEPVVAEPNEKEPQADKFTFRLKNGKEFSGFLDEKAAITMLVADTKVEIPVYKVQALQFDPNDPGKATVQLRDRNSITAQIVPATIELLADWGKVSLNTSSLSTMRLAR